MFVSQKMVNALEPTVKMALHDSFEKNLQGKEQEEGRGGGGKGKKKGSYLKLISGMYLEDK